MAEKNAYQSESCAHPGHLGLALGLITEVNKFTTSNFEKKWETTGSYAKPENKTEFHHINVNIPDAITTGRGINMIQEFLTLTAEEPGNCTEILPEMHNHLEN
ncbi:hypothetical protein CIHG_10144 [Coccidioides immitis H538.4]|uniref:Uncharacterized protein n=1 Tax=Coccidioides immitis H538.4 TaxID=396776 RepID=A0A0J8S637_COCIT|nr:hypothetical protein CIHG_10144 [Coccidioides immitis H538.4]